MIDGGYLVFQFQGRICNEFITINLGQQVRALRSFLAQLSDDPLVRVVQPIGTAYFCDVEQAGQLVHCHHDFFLYFNSFQTRTASAACPDTIPIAPVIDFIKPPIKNIRGFVAAVHAVPNQALCSHQLKFFNSVEKVEVACTICMVKILTGKTPDFRREQLAHRRNLFRCLLALSTRQNGMQVDGVRPNGLPCSTQSARVLVACNDVFDGPGHWFSYAIARITNLRKRSKMEGLACHVAQPSSVWPLIRMSSCSL